MKQKFYAVRNGKKCGIFRTWEECSEQVSGFTGAEYKSFSTETEALAYLNGTEAKLPHEKYLADGYLVAYCDGSYDDSVKKFSYGVVIINKDGSTTELSGCSDDERYLDSRNIGGEILGALHAIRYAIDKGYSKVVLFHDLEGLCRWATKEWKANTLVTKKYQDVINKHFRPQIRIAFEKVAGHTNNKYNDMADELAKKALTYTKIDDLSILEIPMLF